MATTKQLEQQLNDSVSDLNGKLDRVVESTNDAIGEIDDKFDRLLRAIDNPVAPKKPFEPMEQDFGPDETMEFQEQANGEVILPKPGQAVDDPVFKAKQDELKFMEEPVDVFIQDSTDPNADQVFAVLVSGKTFVFERGKQFNGVPRKFVEGLARAKPVHFQCQEYVNSSGVKGYRYPAHKSPRYPFSIMHDPNPRGRDWLTSVLRQP